MSKNDYQAIAREMYIVSELVTAGEPAHVIMAEVNEALARLFTADNPQFDRARFLEACETGTWKGMRKEAR